jgi:hypothetical protein
MTPYLSRSVVSLSWLAVAAAGVLCPRANAQMTMLPGSLSCTLSSIATGDYVLPNCFKNGISYLDSITLYVSAICQSCTGAEVTPQVQLTQDIGLASSGCPSGVAWQASGGMQTGGATGAYVYANFSAQSAKAFARLSGSEDCNLVPIYSGPIGQTLPC